MPLACEIHRQPLRQHAHADLPHRVRRLAAEEAGIDRWADDDDAPAVGLLREDGQGGADGGVETFGVDLLHEAEALEGGLVDGGPPYRAGVVDQDIEPACGGHGVGDEFLDESRVADVAGEGQDGMAELGDLAGDGGDGGEG